MKPVEMGVIGCGVMGNLHARVATESPLMRVAAVADVIEERATKLAAERNVTAVYDSGDALLEDPGVEAVVLALPTRHRTELALSALARGKHVLIEKPIAMNGAEVERMIEARGDLVAACCSSRFRFPASAAAATECIASGALGKIRVVHARAMAQADPPPEEPRPTWRLRKAENGGGYLVNWGCYDLDYLLGITGWSLKPKTVLAQTWTVPPPYEAHLPPDSDAETHFVILVRCECGAVISFERGEYMASRSEGAWQVVGDRGTLQLNMLPADNKKIELDRADPDRGIVSETVFEGGEAWEVLHAGADEDFAAAIREGRPPSTTLERALVVQKITDAVYESAARGVAVEIE